MSVLLAEALRGLDLRPGKTYRATVDGRTVELRVGEDTTTPGAAESVLLQPWVELPFEPVGTVTARPGPVPLPDPPVLPVEDGEL